MANSQPSTHQAYQALPQEGDALPTAVDTYIKQHLHSADNHNILERIRSDSLLAGLPDIACSPTQAKSLMLQARMSNAKRILEVGTLGGYSAAWFSTTSPETKVTTIELDPRNASVARQNLDKAGLGEKVEILQGLAIDVMTDLKGQVQRGEREKFDFAFIDANKQDNLAYFNLAMDMTVERAVLIVDNVVRDGKVSSAAEADKDDRVKGARDLVEGVGKLDTVEATVIQTVGEKHYDGYLLAMKK